MGTCFSSSTKLEQQIELVERIQDIVSDLEATRRVLEWETQLYIDISKEEESDEVR